MINSSVSPYCDFRIIIKAFALPGYMSTVRIVRSERSYYCYIHMPTFRVVLLLRNLSSDGKLSLRDDKNTAFI